MRAIVGYQACLSNAVLSSALSNGRLVWYMHLEKARSAFLVTPAELPCHLWTIYVRCSMTLR